jgi:hypothetical protein
LCVFRFRHEVRGEWPESNRRRGSYSPACGPLCSSNRVPARRLTIATTWRAITRGESEKVAT